MNSFELIELSSINKVSLVWVSSSSNTRSIRDGSYWISRENSLELIELPRINEVTFFLGPSGARSNVFSSRKQRQATCNSCNNIISGNFVSVTLIKAGFFTIKTHYISPQNEPNIIHTKSNTLKRVLNFHHFFFRFQVKHVW